MKTYTITEEDLNVLQDCFDAALCCTNSPAKLYYIWENKVQVIKRNCKWDLEYSVEEKSMTEHPIVCEHIGCKNPAAYHFFNQWPACGEHVDDAEKMLRENVNEIITRQPISTFSKEEHAKILNRHRRE